MLKNKSTVASMPVSRAARHSAPRRPESIRLKDTLSPTPRDRTTTTTTDHPFVRSVDSSCVAKRRSRILLRTEIHLPTEFSSRNHWRKKIWGKTSKETKRKVARKKGVFSKNRHQRLVCSFSFRNPFSKSEKNEFHEDSGRSV